MCAEKNNFLLDIVSKGLCTRCGSCVGLSDGKISFEDKENNYIPKITNEIKESILDKIEHSCSGKYVNFPELTRFVFGNTLKPHPFIGVTNGLFIGYATDPQIRRHCASAGVLSQLLIYLLETGRVSGSVVLGMDTKQPWQTKPYIATTKKDILRAAQSKYIISSVNEILQQTKNFPGPISYTALPCQIHSIRKLQMIDAEETKPIKYIIGPFCGNTLHFTSIISLLKSYGIKNYQDIAYLSFREGEWPGNTCIRMHSGQTITLPKFHANYLIPFHIMKRCLLCVDLCNELTDISIGDAWAPVYEERKKGFSLVISRTPQGLDLLQECAQNGYIHLEPISIEDAVRMHSHGYDLKKRGAFIRMGFLSKLKKDVPEYGYSFKGFPFRRYVMEVIIDFLFIILGKKISIWFLEHIHPEWMGKIFSNLRIFWKKATHNIKRSHLAETQNPNKEREYPNGH